MMKTKMFLIALFFLVLFGCNGNQISEDTAFRIDVLYSHTLLMEPVSTPEQLEAIGLDISKLSRDESLDAISKILEMESSYGLAGEGDYESHLYVLEEVMKRMMNE